MSLTVPLLAAALGGGGIVAALWLTPDEHTAETMREAIAVARDAIRDSAASSPVAQALKRECLALAEHAVQRADATPDGDAASLKALAAMAAHVKSQHEALLIARDLAVLVLQSAARDSDEPELLVGGPAVRAWALAGVRSALGLERVLPEHALSGSARDLYTADFS